jgi:hypothetical protein
MFLNSSKSSGNIRVNNWRRRGKRHHGGGSGGCGASEGGGGGTRLEIASIVADGGFDCDC